MIAIVILRYAIGYTYGAGRNCAAIQRFRSISAPLARCSPASSGADPPFRADLSELPPLSTWVRTDRRHSRYDGGSYRTVRNYMARSARAASIVVFWRWRSPPAPDAADALTPAISTGFADASSCRRQSGVVDLERRAEDAAARSDRGQDRPRPQAPDRGAIPHRCCEERPCAHSRRGARQPPPSPRSANFGRADPTLRRGA